MCDGAKICCSDATSCDPCPPLGGSRAALGAAVPSSSGWQELPTEALCNPLIFYRHAIKIARTLFLFYTVLRRRESCAAGQHLHVK